MGGLVQDLRYALRMWRKSPGFAAITVLTLALGIGANTAIFSLVYAALLRPLPYRDADRLAVLNETTPKVGTVSVSYPNFLDWRAQSRRFSRMAFVHSGDFDLGEAARPQIVSVESVSPDFLSLLGVRPLLGRDFDASEKDPGAAPVAILSYAVWQSRFGGDPTVPGRTITLDDRPVTVVGVLPPGFRSVDRPDVLLPIGLWRAWNPDNAAARGARDNSVVLGRLAPGASLPEARTEMQGIAARLAKAYPATDALFGVKLQPVRDFFVGEARPSLLVLFGAVVFVLLIACANVANLLLSRGAARGREVALRVALGASHLRIASQMMIESLVLACAGGLLGLLVAAAGIRAAAALVPKDVLGGAPLGLDGPVLLFTGVIVVFVTCLFGTAPALRLARPDVRSELKESGRGTGGGVRLSRLHGLQAGSEIALALVLVSGAGLMMRSMHRLLSVDPGFRASHVLTAQIGLRGKRYTREAEVLDFWRQLLARVRALPGVQHAAVGTVVPFTANHDRADITIDGMPLPAAGAFPHPDVHIVSPGYLSSLGIALLQGRDFTRADDRKAPLVGVINADLARRYFPHQRPIGKRFMFGHPAAGEAPRWITIVGEVADTKLYGLANPARLEVYVPYQQHTPHGMMLLVRSEGDPERLTSALRGAVASIDPSQPVADVATMDALRTASVGDRRTTLILLGVFGGLALLLASIGIYGVMSYSVSRRAHEIGIRMALGARQGDVLRTVLARGGSIALAGVAAGLAAALALTRLLTGLLYSVSPSDPLTLLIAASLLVAIALLASYVPARRAARVDPMEALREE